MADFDIVVVGELNPDLILQGDVTPEFGQVEKQVQDATLTVGSSSGIFACGAARLGLRVAFIGKVGADEFGAYMERELARRGINTRGIVADARIKTGLSVILSRGNDRAILTFSGSISALRYDDINQSIMGRARHLHVGAYYMLDALRPQIPDLLKTAHDLGLSTSLDTNYDPTDQWEGGIAQTLKYVDVFLPNETELLAIARTRNRAVAIEQLAAQVPVLAVKLGAEGAIVRRGTETASASSLQVQAVDTTGAGDSFDAGFVYGYLSGWDLSRALRLACACGSLSTRAAGGTAAQPTLAEAINVVT